MGKFQFLLDTGGYCFLCLKLRNGPGLELEPTNVHQNVSETTSFRNICQYLKTNLVEIFGEAVPRSSSTLPVLEQSEMKGTLCDGCGHHFEKFSRLFLELEVVKMKLEDCMRTIHDVLTDVGKKECQGLETFKEEMLKRPETLAHYGIVERLRKNIFFRSSSLMGKAGPRVALKLVSKLSPAIAESEQEIIATPPPQTPPVETFQTTPSLSNLEDSVLKNNDKNSNLESQGLTPVAPVSQSDSSLVKNTAPKVVLKSASMSATHPIISASGRNLIDKLPSLIPTIEIIQTTPSSPEPGGGSVLQNDDRNDNSQDLNTDEPVPQSDATDSEFVLWECDICHLKVSDLSTHLYTAHFDVDGGSCTQAHNVEAEPMECNDGPPIIENFPPSIQIGGHVELSTTNLNMLSTNRPVAGSSHNDYSSTNANWKFKCHLCKNGFEEKSMLTEHQQKDHFGKKYRCRFCSDWFTSLKGRGIHERKICPMKKLQNIGTDHSGSLAISSSSDFPMLYNCDICHKIFISQQAKSRHHNEDHAGHKYCCDQCHETFSTYYQKYNHKKICIAVQEQDAP